MKNQLRILHIMHDEKFIDIFVDKFFEDGMVNTIIILKDNIRYQGKHINSIIKIVPFSAPYFELSKSQSKYDFIFLYNLDYEKAFLVNHIFNGGLPKLIWNFFGTEIYNNTSFPFFKNLYSPNTRKLITNNIIFNYKKPLRYIKYFIKGRSTPSKEVIRAMKKITYLAWYSEEEYEYLKKKVDFLPPFLQYPLDNIVPKLVQRGPTSCYNILLGNSSAPENNHLDILLFLEDLGFKGKVIIPFSYGGNMAYKVNLRNRSKLINLQLKFLEDFLQYYEYISEISNCQIAIYNSFRQMAIGNILISIKNGSKIYLSERNISYIWLKNFGFIIFSIEKNLKEDFKNNSILLSDEYKLKNSCLYNKLTDKTNIDSFLHKLRNNTI